MARNLWNPRRFGLSGPMVGIIVAVLVLLVVVILWVRKGCSETPQAGKVELATTVIQPPAPKAVTPESSNTTKPPAELPKTPEHPAEPKTTETQTPDISAKFWEAGKNALANREYVSARDQFSQALKGTKDPSAQKMIQQQLAAIANELTFSRYVKLGDTTAESYHVKSGETPSEVAKRFNIPAKLFMKVNNIPDARSMRADRDYKVIKGPFNVVVNKKTFQLDVFLKDYFIKSYTIGLGRDNSTPAETFLAGPKLQKPEWIGDVDGSGRRVRVPYGDPRNPLGNHWISLSRFSGSSDLGVNTDYGIHGTNEPQTIGTQASHGCIRMRNEEVAELFDLLVTGKSRITILAD